MDNEDIKRKIVKARQAKPNQGHAKTAMGALDLTSLNSDKTIADIMVFCEKAKGGHVAAVCVYPNMVRTAAEFLRSHNVEVATVINFPFGDKTNEGDIATPENTAKAIKQAIANGATEIDMVMDYKDFTEENAQKLSRACRKACDEGKAKMKVILEVEDGIASTDLAVRCELAIKCGADMIKTSTGKYPEKMNDFEKMESVLIMLNTIKKQSDGLNVGLKISGGVNGENYAQYLALVGQEMGQDFVSNPKLFRFGASALYDDLKLSLDKNTSMMPQRQKATLGY